jgi:hypothetical protein
MSSGRLHKVALVGIDAGAESNDTSRWDCFEWTSLYQKVNLHDYDTWVFYIPSFPTKVARDALYNLLTVDYVFQALISGTRILLIGDPRFTVEFANQPPRPFLWWTGYDFLWKSVGGDTKEVIDSSDTFQIQDYLRKLTRWDYALVEMNKSEAHRYAPCVEVARENGQSLGLIPRSLSVNRNGECISFALTLCQYEINDRREISRFESIVFIPTNGFEPVEALRLILKDALDISLAQEEPTWAAELTAPGQGSVDADISSIESEIANLKAQLNEKLAVKEKCRECLQAIYQIGTPLEISVKNLIRELGGMIEEAPQKGYCDCYLTVNFKSSEHKAVVEIKGTRNPQFDMKGFRQVLQWKADAMIERGEEYRAVFIGNSATETPPTKRSDPFGEGWRKQTKLHRVTALTSTTLYEAYCAMKKRSLDIDKFWESLLTTDGIFVLDDSHINSDGTHNETA